MIYDSLATNFKESLNPIWIWTRNLAIKAVTFDLWLTLIWDSKELEEYRRLRRLVNFYRFVNRIHRGRGIEEDSSFSFNDVRLALEELGEEVEQDYERGEDVSPGERGRRLFRKLKIKVDEDEVYEKAGVILSNSGYMKKFPNLNPQAKPALRGLKKKFPDLKIGLVSNAARSTETYKRTLKALGIANYFDAFLISCEIGYLKPRKEIFEHAVKQIGVKPQETLHVGDLFRADLVGAVDCRINACLYTGLWKKYAQYMNPGEHIPKDFKLPKNLVAREINDLRQVVEVVEEINRKS